MLLCLTEAIALSFATFGEAKIDPIHLSDVMCNGAEAILTDCNHRRNPTCTHDEDAGVICIRKL